MADTPPWRWVADGPNGQVVLTVTFDGAAAQVRAAGPDATHRQTVPLSASPPPDVTPATLPVDDMASVGATLDRLCDQLGLTFLPDETPHP